MDSQIRTFKDYLELYNKITELCFKSCVDNLFSRNLESEEEMCVNKCVQKFANVNQRIMGVYVEVQTTINNRRMAELEAQTQEAAAKAAQAQEAAAQAAQIPQTSTEVQTPATLSGKR